MNENILLIGQNGQLGSEWRYLFETRDIPYTGVGSSELDITDAEAVHQLIDRTQPDYIINCASYTAVDAAEDNQEMAMRVNRDGTRNVAEAASSHEATLIHYSTDYVFPGYKEDKDRYTRGYDEQAPVKPVNFYGKSKLEGEEAIRENHDKYIIMRISWLNGVYGSNFIKTIVRLTREKEEISVVNDQYGAPTFAANVVRNTVSLIQNGFYGLIHLSCGGLVTWHDIASEVLDQTGAKARLKAVSTEEFGSRAPRPNFSKLDNRLICSFEGHRIQNWRVGVRQLLRDPRFNVDK